MSGTGVGASRRWAAFRKAMREAHGPLRPVRSPTDGPRPCRFDGDEPVRELVFSYLLWDAPLSTAQEAMERLSCAVVDVNDLRVCSADEMLAMLGAGYPRVEERASRLRVSLRALFASENRLRLGHLAGKAPATVRKQLRALGEPPSFVVERTLLVGFGHPAVPVDERTAARLADCGVLHPGTDAAAASAWLLESTPEGEVAEAAAWLQAWADAGGRAPAGLERAGGGGAAGRGGAEKRGGPGGKGGKGGRQSGRGGKA